MIISGQLVQLAESFEAYRDKGLSLESPGVVSLIGLLLMLAREADALEMARDRPTPPRACQAPPWGWGDSAPASEGDAA